MASLLRNLQPHGQCHLEGSHSTICPCGWKERSSLLLRSLQKGIYSILKFVDVFENFFMAETILVSNYQQKLHRSSRSELCKMIVSNVSNRTVLTSSVRQWKFRPYGTHIWLQVWNSEDVFWKKKQKSWRKYTDSIFWAARIPHLGFFLWHNTAPLPVR